MKLMVLKSMTVYSVGHAVGNRHSHILLGECNPVQPLGGMIWQYLTKLHPTSRNLPGQYIFNNMKKYMHTVIHFSIIYNCNIFETI